LADYLLKSDINTVGLFPNERTLQFPDTEGTNISVTVPSRKIVEKGGVMYLLVRLVRQVDGSSVVVLPGEVYGSGRIVAVPSNRLELVSA
jgi:hypothetical protein